MKIDLNQDRSRQDTLKGAVCESWSLVKDLKSNLTTRIFKRDGAGQLIKQMLMGS